MLIRIVVFLCIFVSCPVFAHDDGASHEHENGMGWGSRYTLAEGDTLTISTAGTNCSMVFLGQGELGFEIGVSLYTTDQFAEKFFSGTFPVQSGETFQAGQLFWRVLHKPDGNIMLESVRQE